MGDDWMPYEEYCDMVSENARAKHNVYLGSNEWKEKREIILKRDNYICQDCGVKCIGKRDATKDNSDKIIQCHHIENYNKGHNNNKSNLITLCLKCHLKRHKKN